MTLYRSLIIGLYKNPINKRKMYNPDIAASGANIACGDRVRIYAKFARVKATHNRGQNRGRKNNSRAKISEVSFEGEGCAISIAAASLLTQKAIGMTPAQIMKWSAKDVFGWLGQELGPNRAKCGLLALETLQKGITTCHPKFIDTHTISSRQQDGTCRAQWPKPQLLTQTSTVLARVSRIPARIYTTRLLSLA